jgi:hypothetical protein
LNSGFAKAFAQIICCPARNLRQKTLIIQEVSVFTDAHKKAVPTNQKTAFPYFVGKICAD